MEDNSLGEKADAYISTMRQHFATYHNHKEQMAYIITALYLAGISALLVHKKSAAITAAPSWLTVLVDTALCGAVLAFVWWQFSMKNLASKIISSRDILRGQ